MLLGYQPLKDGVCNDVLDMVEGIAGETVIKLTGEEKEIKEIYDLDKKMECRIGDINNGWEQGLRSSRPWHGAPMMLVKLDHHK